MKYCKSKFFLIILVCSFSLFGVSGTERIGRNVKIRGRGVCYMDPGITPEKASLIAKYDALNDILSTAGSYFERNDSLLNEKMRRNQIALILGNNLDIFIYREGEENLDGYPTYTSYVTAEINIDNLNRNILEANTDNHKRYILRSEKRRLDTLFGKIKSMGLTTSRVSQEFIDDLISKLTATEWANKANREKSEGIRMDYFLIALDYDIRYEAAYLGLADTMIRIGRYTDLLNKLTSILIADPLNFPALYAKRGEVFLNLKQYNSAITELEKAIAMAPDYADAYCLLARAHSETGNNSAALTRYVQAIKADGNFYKPFFQRAILFRKEGKYDDALRDLDNAVNLNPMNAVTFFNRGIVLYFMGNLERAAEEFSKAIFLDELTADFFFNRALVYRKLNMMRRATDDYRTYLLLTQQKLSRESYAELVEKWMDNENIVPLFLE